MDNQSVSFFAACFALFVGVWVMIDATRRGKDGLSAFIWGFATFLLLCAFLPLWLIFRPAIPDPGGANPIVCPACGQQTDPSKAYCDYCGGAIWDKTP